MKWYLFQSWGLAETSNTYVGEGKAYYYAVNSFITYSASLVTTSDSLFFRIKAYLILIWWECRIKCQFQFCAPFHKIG